jgi:protein-tyrosine phosphatase
VLEVLFVCTGNICRSPLAEAFLHDRSERLLDGSVNVRSAGTWGRAGHPPTPETVDAGEARGVDVRGHRARPLHPRVIGSADLVLGMTREHRAEVVSMLPSAEPNAFTLKELAALVGELDPAAPGGDREAVLARVAEAHRLRSGPEAPSVPDQDIADPIGFGADIYAAIAGEIEEAVDALVDGLFGTSEPARAGGEGTGES